MKYFIYARKSQEDKGKQIQSIEDQIRIAKEVAKRRGLEVVEILEESKKASVPGRPKFNYMINQIKAGKAEGIICWKLDRLSRNPIDGGNIIWMLQKNVISQIITNDRDYFPHDNMLTMYVELGMANQFSLDLGKNAKRGMKSKCNKGWLPGVAPQGYMNDKYREKGDKTIVRDEERFFMVRKMWDLFLTGQYSIKKITQIANKEWGYLTPRRKNRGGVPIGVSTLYGILKNPFYYGEFEWDGNLYQGSHEPMITRAEFDHAQKILKNRGRPRPKDKEFAFTGLIRCGECGYMITAQENTKYLKTEKRVKQYTYYFCTHKSKTIDCKQKAIEKEELESQINEFLETLSIEEVHIDWVIKYLHEFNEYESSDNSKTLESLNKRLKQCAKELSNLIRLKISDENMLTDQEFKDEKMRLMREKESVLEAIEKASDRQNDWVNSAEKAVNFLRNIHERFNEGSIEEKKIILSTTGSNLMIKDKILSIQANAEYIPLQKGIQKTKVLIKRFKPQKGRLNTAKKTFQNEMNLVWLLGLDSNQ